MERYKKLTLLHSNDMHGDFLPQTVDGKQTGGVAMLSGYIGRVREEEPNTLYCIAGDMFRGSVIDSEFRGVSTIEIVNLLLPDVVTLGNHETDYGLGHLLFLEKCARFPIINANLHVKSNGARLFRPYLVEEIDGMRVLFIGILTEDVIAETRKDELIGSLVDVGEAVEEIGRICNAYNGEDIDLTVLLTHIGFEEDKKLAAKIDPAWGVDVIVGGHSHTYLTEPAEVNGILIAQAGTGTDLIGRFDLTVDTLLNRVADYRWTPVPINEETSVPDPAIEVMIGDYKSVTDRKYGRVVTRFRRRLTHPSRIQETALGNLFADALSESLGVDIMLLASGSIRVKALGPVVLFGDLVEAFPFDDAAYLVTVSGATLRTMLTYMLRDEIFTGIHCEFYQFSDGLRAVWDRETHTFEELTFRNEPVEDARHYTLGMQGYHFTNFADIFRLPPETVRAVAPPRVVATSCKQVLEEYLASHPRHDRRAGKRIVIK